jgi:ABC-type multidrug transport system fused ATPase/permease subunit
MLLRIFKYIRPFWRTLLGLALLITVMAAFNQTEPFVSKRITDLIVNQHSPAMFNQLLMLLGVFLVVKFTQSILNRITWWITNILTVRIETHLKQIGFDHMMKLSMAFYNDQSSGKMMTKLDRGVNRIVQIVNNSGAQFLPSLITAIFAFSVVLHYEWRIGATIILAFVPYIAINRWRFLRNSKLEKQEYKLYENQYSHFWEVLSSMSLIKAFRAEQWERSKMRKFFHDYLGIRQKMEINTNRAAVGDLFLETWSWGIYSFIAWLAWQGNITIGTMVLLIGLIQLIRQPLWQLNWIFWEVKRAEIGAKDFFRIMDVQPEIVDSAQTVSLTQPLRGEIVFDHVSFAYKNGTQLVTDDTTLEKKTATEQQPVFADVSFVLPAGRTTAFVGPSGSGKTTVAALVMRYFDPDQGTITLDGVDLRRLSQAELRAQLGIVSQDAFLFADTIAENLRYAKPDATEEEMWAACAVAYAEDFIRKLPKGLQTEIGDRGVKLSGGQRQRLSLARTILANPKIILLDEATSALDSESEMYIQQSLAKLLKNRTAVVIAHRLSTIQRADQIIVIKDKQVFERGTHAQLLKRDGLYASLFKIQSGNAAKLKEWDLVG